MAEVGIQTLERDAASVVAMAAAGEPVTITERGRPVARMVPYTGSRIEEMIAEGRARPAHRRLSALSAPARERPGQPALSQRLQGMRNAERY